MKINLSPKQSLKQTVNLHLWNPILQSNIAQLNKHIEKFAQNNPVVHIDNSSYFEDYFSYSANDKSLLDTLLEQIEESSLFPTPVSKEVAYEILNDINPEGYFDGDLKKIALHFNKDISFINSIRKRFLYLDPLGVGALDFKEAILFQVDEIEISETHRIKFKDAIKKFDFKDLVSNSSSFSKILKKMNIPPAIEYLDEDIPVIVDFIVTLNNGKMDIQYNDKVSSNIVIDYDLKGSSKIIDEKIKEAKSLVELLNLRKKTLYKIVLSIINSQEQFFYEYKDLKPLTMQNIADELELVQSTISRAISNKYIEFDRKTYSLKSFFVTSCGKDDISQELIKKLIKEYIQNEDVTNPFSDEDLKNLINKKLNTNLSRRVISKHRLNLSILSSTKRKIIYNL